MLDRGDADAIGIAYADDGPGKLPLTVASVSPPTTDSCGYRAYYVTVQNPNSFAVSTT